MAYSKNVNIIKTPPISTENRHTIDGIKIYQSIPQAIKVLEEMLYQQALGNGHVWKYEIGDMKIHSIQIILPLAGTAWLIVPSMTGAEIQDVIDIVGEEGGGSLYFVEGEYLLQDPLLIRHSNIHIYGQNLNTVLKCSADWRYAISKTDGSLLPIEYRVPENGEYAGIIDIRGTEEYILENIKVSGIALDGDREVGYSYGIYSEHTGLAQTTGLTEGVVRYDSSTVGADKPNKIGVQIENCYVQNNSDYGIYLDTSPNNTITGNTVQNNGGYGIWLSQSTRNNTITGNTIQNNGNSGIYLTSSSNNNTITSNTIQNNGGYGIYLQASSNSTIIGNTVQNNGGYGIMLSSSSNNTITGNRVTGNDSNGIYLYTSNNNTITSNMVMSNDSNGIYLYTSNNNTITSNMVMNNSSTNILIDVGADYNLICSNQHSDSISNSGTGNKVYNNK